jgi:2-keto-4-pentenoate hydratase
MNQNQIKQFAGHLITAETSGQGIQALTETVSDLTFQQAYQVQLANIQLRVNQGQTIVGKKVGLTSAALQQRVGINEPIFGFLLDGMRVENDGAISVKQLFEPKVEGEIAFVLKKVLSGPNVTIDDVLQATDYVQPAFEIIDSRFQGKKSPVDSVADNSSSLAYVLGGRPFKTEQLDLAQLKMELIKNGEIINAGIGSAAMGHPALSVAWLANKLYQYEITLKAGETILSGSLAPAVSAQFADHFQARIENLGEVSVFFAE